MSNAALGISLSTLVRFSAVFVSVPNTVCDLLYWHSASLSIIDNVEWCSIRAEVRWLPELKLLNGVLYITTKALSLTS
jgi:hypothetical protein